MGCRTVEFERNAGHRTAAGIDRAYVDSLTGVAAGAEDRKGHQRSSSPTQ
jgi:hypothetical protein